MLGAALVLQPHTVTKDRLRQAINAILTEPQYRTASQACQKRLQSAPTVDDAARLISQALTTGTRITRQS
jgi:UDP:flavonoid glycosyltransferase YjiC (YdhE family)